MVAVDPAHRGQGLGRRLAEHITSDNPAILWVMHAQREGSVEFCERLGFSKSESLMIRSRG